MYSSKPNILQLVALLIQYDIKHIVVSPGSRNAPIVETIEQHPFFRCYTVVDERSAAFFALGLILKTGEAVAVCCTSGTALLNYSSAVAEAFYQQLPLVVISADRPQAWIGQMDGQTLPQATVFNTLVKQSIQLNESKTSEDAWYCNRLINEALTAASTTAPGPVHINIAVSEPLFDFEITKIPTERKIRSYKASQQACFPFLKPLLDSSVRCMLMIGQTDPHLSLSRLLSKHLPSQHVVIIAENIANTRGKGVIYTIDDIIFALPENKAETFAPEILITCEGHIVSKRFKEFIRQFPPKIHIHVSPSGKAPDLFQALTHTVQSEVEPFIDQLLSNGSNVEKADYVTLWHNQSQQINTRTVAYCSKLAYSDLQAMHLLFSKLPEGVALHLANSSTIRNAQLFSLPESTKLYCNRGTNGIDGSMSTAVGYAASKDELSVLVIGDLSFFYDINALWNKYVAGNLRIVLLNNGCGEIFKRIHGLNQTHALNSHIAYRHHTSAQGWCESLDITYLKATDTVSLKAGIATLLSQEMRITRPIILEVFTADETNIETIRAYYKQLKQL